MDPSIDLCKFRSSFTDQLPTGPINPPQGFTLDPNVNLGLKGEITMQSVSNIPPHPKLVNVNDYQRLNNIKDSYAQFDNPDRSDKSSPFKRAIERANPFEHIGSSIFINRAAVKLANIDAVFGLTGHLGGLLALHTPGNLFFCDLAGGPGGFSQYILWRRPEAFGVGITLETTNSRFKWDQTLLDQERFKIYGGEDKTGNLITQAPSFITYAKTLAMVKNIKDITFPRVDLIVADGGIDVVGKENLQEFLSIPLILSEIYVGIMLTSPGGSFVCKVFDTVTEIMAELLLLLAMTFETINIFKPMSSKPGNSERYVVCMNKHPDDKTSIARDLIQQAYTTINSSVNSNVGSTGSNTIVSIFNFDLIPSSLINYIYQTNQASIQAQTEIGIQVQRLLSSQPITLYKYNLNYSLIIWNLSSNPETRYGRNLQLSGTTSFPGCDRPSKGTIPYPESSRSARGRGRGFIPRGSSRGSFASSSRGSSGGRSFR